MCSIVSGSVRFTRLLRFIFRDFDPLTVVASGATLWVFVGAARTALRESVTDAEQPLIVASRASINSYLKRAGKTIGDAYVDHLVEPADDCSQSTALAGHMPKRSLHGW